MGQEQFETFGLEGQIVYNFKTKLMFTQHCEGVELPRNPVFLVIDAVILQIVSRASPKYIIS